MRLWCVQEGSMKERESNVLSLLEDKTNIYARKIALGIKHNLVGKSLLMTVLA